MKIYISGLYSGTNPQPGIGIARSLKQAFPQASLIGVEYSNRCSGIHWQDFDDIWLNRSWQELCLDSHAQEIDKILQAGGFWISCNDLEIVWLASVFPNGHQNLLTPPTDALEQLAKPAITAHKSLPVKIPTFVTTELSDWDLHAFCRQHNWKVWLKGPYYEAVRVRTWTEFQHMREVLSTAWSTDKLYLQAHVTGYEESVCFSAYQGKLLDAVRMRKRDLTELSKTWAGDVTPVPGAFYSALADTIQKLNWTGGAELEMVRDADDQLWLLEVNPRYPAWVHGATITGTNLAAALVEAASGVRAQTTRPSGEEFTRVVLEIPVRSEFPLPALPEPFAGGVGHSLKHPSGLLGFADKLHKRRLETDGIAQNAQTEADLAFNIPDSFKDDIEAVEFKEVQTPAFIFMEKTAGKLFYNAAQFADAANETDVEFSYAYSIKTNPDERILKHAFEAGMLAEAISPLEVKKALDVGFSPSQIVLNGPGKWWQKQFLPAEPIHAVFSDSIADLQRVIRALESGELRTQTAGVRLRTPSISSRFGIPIDSPKLFQTLVEAIDLLPRDCAFGVHFHMASSNIGVEQWWHLFHSMLKWCSSLETLSGRPIELLDMGGGWFPDDWHGGSDNRLTAAIVKVKEHLPNVKRVLAEPGKALAQPSMALAMRILEIQNFENDISEVVVDGSIAELPMAFFQPHRMLHLNSKTGEWNSMKRGSSHLLGRLCMEHDIVATNVCLPGGAEPGDVIVFCDAGAYDRSMSYVFGRG